MTPTQTVQAHYAALARRDRQAALATLSHDVDRLIANGGTVIAFGSERFQVKRTGRCWDVAWVHVHEVGRGRIVRFREFTDTAATAAAYDTSE